MKKTKKLYLRFMYCFWLVVLHWSLELYNFFARSVSYFQPHAEINEN